LADHPSAHARRRSWRQGALTYLDGTQLAEREPSKVPRPRRAPGVEIRTKHKPGAPMHLKSYQIDGRLLRTGAAISRRF
jgi:hypothetical protein